MEHSANRAETERRHESVLDRSVDLTAVSGQMIAWIGVFVVAASIRLVGRTNWPLAPEEAAIARDGYALLHGADLTSSAAVQPAMTLLAALSFFLFGDSDFTARLVSLAGAIGVLALLVWARNWLGNLPALGTAILWSISPVMTMSSMRIDGGIVLVFSVLGILVMVFGLSVNPSTLRSALLGIFTGLAITSHPLGWVFGPVSLVLAVVIVRDPDFRRKIVPAVLAFLAFVILVSTFFITRPLGLVQFFRESFTSLWDNQLSTMGSQWHLRPLALVVEEPAALLLAITAILVSLLGVHRGASASRALILATIAWGIPLITLGILLGGEGPAIYAVSLLPVILLGGFGLAAVIDGCIASSHRSARIALAILLGFGFVVALVRFLDLLSRGPGDAAFGWLLNALALGLLILLPLGVLALRLVREIGFPAVPMALLAVALLLGGIQIRSSLLLASTTIDRPGELLVSGSSAPSVAQISVRIRSYSRDATTHIQDVRDPTGGHGLMIVIEEAWQQPFEWYFRDFPNLLIVASLNELDPEAPVDVIIASSEPESDFLEESETRYGSLSYPGSVHLPESLVDPALRHVLAKLFNPGHFRDNLNFLIYRETESPKQTEEFTLTLREDHALIVWGWLPE